MRLIVCDLAGRLVKTLIADNLGVGLQTVTWDGSDRHGAQVASGVYFLRLETEQEISTRKLMLAK